MCLKIHILGVNYMYIYILMCLKIHILGVSYIYIYIYINVFEDPHPGC